MDGLFSFLVFAVVAFLLSRVNKSKQKKPGTTAAKPAAAPRPQAAAPTEQQPMPNPERWQDFVPAFETEIHPIDSERTYEEGIDPCHDDMPSAAEEPVSPAAPAPNPLANELVRGFVMGEVLSRKRRR